MKVIDDSEFAEFFEAVSKTNLTEGFKRPALNSKYKLKSNIIYLTDSCNLKCDYCYQLDDREKLDKPSYISKEQVDKFFIDLLEREPEKASTVVLFGGEPFLNPKMIYYILDLTDKITEEKNKKFNLSLTTNGIYFLDTKNADTFSSRIKSLKNHFSLEISYDVSGHDRRVYNNNKSSKEDVEKVLDYFKKINFPITIRYTIHKDNYKSALRDLIYLSLDKNYNKIVVNFYESELEKFINVDKFKDTLKRQSCEIFKRTKKPICHLNCLACMGCNFEEFDGIHYQYNDKDFEVKGNAEVFNSFIKNK